MKFKFFSRSPIALRTAAFSVNAYKKYFFLDMNGTLSESKRYEFRAHYQSLEHFKNKYSLKYSLPALSEFEINLENLFSADASFKIEILFPEIKSFKKEYEVYAETYFEEIRKIAGLNYFIPSSVNFLKYLIDLNHPVCVVSGSYRHSILRNLTLLGLEKKVAYIGREDYQIPKPNPQPYLIAAQRMKIIPNKKYCIAVENSEYGIISAKNADMFTIGLARNPFLREKLLLAGADKVVHDLEEVSLESETINANGLKYPNSRSNF